VQLFYTTQISASLWILAGNKRFEHGSDRRGQILFIDARALGSLVDRTRREFSESEIMQIAGAYRLWKGVAQEADYADIAGFCRSTTIKTVCEHHWALVPGRYVGFDRSGLSTKAIHKLEEDFAELKAALTTLPDEVDKSIRIFEELFHG
jgi:type I restriction enzyme M protein